jgi:hypothetical protein
MTRPGDRLRTFASRLFAVQTMERVIEPILADLQCEYDAARARGLLWRARLSLVRSYCAFAMALFWLGVRTAWSTDDPRPDVVRICLVAGVASAIMTVALVIPPLLRWPSWRGDPAFTALLSVTLVPQALPLSIPAGLCVAVVWGMRGRAVTWRQAGTVLAVALASTAVVWFVLEWLMPQANQGFRELVAARLSGGRVVTLEPGLSELGLSRLGRRSDPAAVRQYQVLWALCCASVPLSLLALGLARYVKRGLSAVLLATALANAYLAILWARAGGPVEPAVSVSVAAWTPNVICVLVGCALLMRPRCPKGIGVAE